MRRLLVLPLLVVVAMFVVGAGDPETPAPRPEAARPAPPVHADAAALERAVLDTTAAFLHEDLPAARAALDRVEAACRRLGPDDTPAYASELVVYDQAFHVTIDRAREFAGRGIADKAFDQFVWMQRGCRACHDLARKSGSMK